MSRTTIDLALHRFLRGEYAPAAQAFQDILQTEPRNGRAWSYLGASLAHLGDASGAKHALARALELGPNDAEAWFHLGVVCSLRSDWPAAAGAFRKAVALAPRDLVAWHRLGVALSENGDEWGAASAFERALFLSGEADGSDPAGSISEEPPEAHVTEGGETESGLEVKSWLKLALSLLSLGEVEEAIAAYERAYTLDPERARQSLFRPMLHLVTSRGGLPPEGSSEGAAEGDDGPTPDHPPGELSRTLFDRDLGF